ncbi:MAG: hypothetical protein JWR17_1830 [Pseudomonas sp.]|jgi:hypothetical protein|uniref:hypothetical protein n=1 Tax=Pseudomonas sp. TaxID=306 RepID=UPI002637F821|nr:hypothetical protein [Pseudomonas sp.]MDB6049084.1 hypothetical protein [Pseudomonas sp.]
MAIYEVRLSTEDLENDMSPEVLVEFYDKNELEYVASVSSSKKDGVLDKVSGETDIDGEAGYTKADDEIMISLATAFSKIKFV